MDENTKTTYWGRPCPKHVPFRKAVRYKSSHRCIECSRESTARSYAKLKAAAAGNVPPPQTPDTGDDLI